MHERELQHQIYKHSLYGDGNDSQKCRAISLIISSSVKHIAKTTVKRKRDVKLLLKHANRFKQFTPLK